MPRRFSLRTDCLLLLASTLFSAAVCAADQTPPRQVQDLHYGEVLFYFYQGDYFDAITHALSAQQQQQVPHHQQDTSLLTGGMKLSYGMDRDARQVFGSLLDASVAGPMRNRAWYYLAKLSYQRDNLAQAQQALTQIQGDLPAALAPQQLLLRAQVLMAQGHYDQAAALLDGWKGPKDWQAYVRFNLGVALMRAGDTAAGERQLDAVGQINSDSEELLALRDKANLALGYTLLQNKEPARARQYLERVRLQGPFSNQALLAFGWTASAQDQQEQALVPWQELSGRAVIDGAVQESLLAVPYAYAQLQAYPAAAQRYQQAIGAYEKEIRNLDSAIADIRRGKLLETMLGSTQDHSDMGWSWRAAPPPQATETRYLWQLLAGHEFQTALKNYRDLLFLQNNLARWSSSIDAYQDMLDNREARYEKQLPQTQGRMQSLDLKAITAQRDALAKRLAEIERTRDAMALASARELDWQARMTRIGQRLDRLQATPETSALRERLRIVQGVQVWQLSVDYPARLRHTQLSLRGLDAGVAALQGRWSSIETAQQEAPRGFTGYGQRIAALRARIVALQPRVDSVSAAQAQQLQNVAITALEGHKRHLAEYRVQAQLALAQLYDRASTAPQATP